MSDISPWDSISRPFQKCLFRRKGNPLQTEISLSPYYLATFFWYHSPRVDLKRTKGSAEVVFIAIWACPPASSENSCLISIPKSKSRPQITEVLSSRIMFRRNLLKTVSQTYASNDTSPNNVFYAAFWKCILPTCFSLEFLVFSCTSRDVSTRLLLCVGINRTSNRAPNHLPLMLKPQCTPLEGRCSRHQALRRDFHWRQSVKLLILASVIRQPV